MPFVSLTLFEAVNSSALLPPLPVVYMTWVEDAALSCAHTAPSVSASRWLSGPPSHKNRFPSEVMAKAAW